MMKKSARNSIPERKKHGQFDKIGSKSTKEFVKRL
jgi:hypothetical protein